MSAESPRHARSGGPLTVPSQPPPDRSIIDAVSGFINDVKLTSSSTVDPKDVIQWARFETADINEPTPEGDADTDEPPLLLILGYGAGVQVWLIPPTGEAQEVLSWRQGTVRVLRILPTPVKGDCFVPKRPLIALCDSASPGPAFCSLSFISIRGGEQVKSIKFKNPILDVLANKRSVVVSFSERFAVFDAGTLEDRMAVTTCYPCPCPLGGTAPINPLALGDRWLAYADKKLNQSKRSSGGCEGEGVSSYTATVLHAAKSLGKGLRGLGESVAHSLAGTRQQHSPSPPAARVDLTQPGVVTVIDIEGLEEEDGQDSEEPYEPMVAHFIAHSEAIIALKFDASGLMLVTADRRGHDFHVFRINPHPCGPGLASVHHLYILHRGDTTAKVQDIAISADSRWAAISTLRGTTHVFAVSPYGGSCGVRTHTHPRVVNRLSRFHRSAGLPIHPADKRSPASPVSEAVGAWFPNPRLPPYPAPTVSTPLAQLRPTPNLATHTVTRNSSGRQRLSSLSEDGSSVPLLARAAWGTSPGAASHTQGAGVAARGAPRAALYLLAAGGTLAHLVLHPRPASNIPKEKICDESPIELSVEAVAQWPLARTPAATDLLAPLPPASPLLQPTSCRRCADMCISEEERWLSQVEIVTHAGPHRRLWMGPQFVFKTYSVTGSTSSLSEAETVEVEAGGGRVARSNPVNMPSAAAAAVPVLVDSGSASSLEHSPSDSYRRKSLLAESGRAASVCDVQLKEDLAEAMKEDHGLARSSSRAEAVSATTFPFGGRRAPALAVDPLGTVVAMGAEEAPPVTPDTPPQPNTDEDAFRCVVRAPAPLPLAAPATRALPAGTVIPAHGLPATPPTPLAAAPRSLATAVRVPAARASILAQPIDYGARDIRPPEDAIAPIPLRPRPSSLDRRAPDLDLPPPPPTSPPPLTAVEPKRRDSPQPSPPPITESPRKKSSRCGTPPKKEVITAKSRRESPDVELDRKSVEVEKESSKAKRESTATKVPKESAESKSSTRKDNPEGKSRKKADETKSISKRDSTEAKSASKKDGDAKSSSKKDSEAKLSSKKDSEIKLSSRNEPTDNIVELVPTRTETKKEPSPSEVRTTANRGWSEIKLSSTSKSSEQEVPPRKEEIESKTLTEEEISDIDRCLQESEIKIPSRRESADREPGKTDSTKLKSSWMKDAESAWSLKSNTIDRKEKSPKKESSESRSTREQRHEEIKTEEQAWDMLLNEPDKPTLNVSLQTTIDKNDDKPKTKRNRKIKKSQDDPQNKSEDDSFVEIHAIEETSETQQSSGELVSISVPYEEIGTSSSYSSKIRKSRSPKSTIERKEESETTVEEWSLEDVQAALKKSSKKKSDATDNIEVPDLDSKLKSKEGKREKVLETKPESIEVAFENLREPSVEKKIKPSAFEPRKSFDKAFESDIKDVYVIDSSKDEFPEIQITRANKTRKSKSPFVDKSAEEKSEKPAIKSWSSIAASKSPTKNDDNVVEKDVETEKKEVTFFDDPELPTTSVSLQEELIRLCKRTDIMVAKCDAPTELNFIDEHHSLLEDLPPLELDFGLDDCKLEVMRDCLMETDTKITSPICKINIDSILSSIKESTSAFNLIDLERVPEKKKKGFSIIESDKITSQEVKVDDDVKVDSKEGVMEKSSDDDNTSPILSTDSDKDDKKPIGAPSVSMPSPKQSSKSKKSRRKKK